MLAGPVPCMVALHGETVIRKPRALSGWWFFWHSCPYKSKCAVLMVKVAKPTSTWLAWWFHGSSQGHLSSFSSHSPSGLPLPGPPEPLQVGFPERKTALFGQVQDSQGWRPSSSLCSLFSYPSAPQTFSQADSDLGTRLWVELKKKVVLDLGVGCGFLFLYFRPGLVLTASGPN